MTQEHPITPPPKLVQQWREQAPRCRDGGIAREDWLMTRAAQWGADQELHECCALVADLGGDGGMIRRYRRPKPPSLREQALDALAHIATGPNPTAFLECQDTIRRALELLPDNE